MSEGEFNNSNSEDRNWELTVRSIVGRLNSILSKRYGCRALYRTHSQLSYEAPEFVARLNNAIAEAGRDQVQVNEEVIMAIRQEGEITGYVVVINGARVEPTKFEEAMTLVSDTLVDSIAKAERLHTLMRIEHNASAQHVSGNVIPFRAHRTAAYVMPLETDQIFQRPRSMTERRPILIQGKSPMAIFKAAIEFQESMQSSALIPFSALSREVLSDPERWHELGSIIVFVENIDSLTRVEIQGLKAVTTLFTGSHCPQLIGGQIDSDDSHLNHSQALLDELFPAKFRNPEKLPSQTKLSDLVDVFVFSDSQSISSTSTLTH